MAIGVGQRRKTCNRLGGDSCEPVTVFCFSWAHAYSRHVLSDDNLLCISEVCHELANFAVYEPYSIVNGSIMLLYVTYLLCVSMFLFA
jgi:hypothetical protein